MRPLVLAAVLVLLVASVGAAGPVVVPPQPETLVEGHVVFTVIEVARPSGNNTTAAREEFAAAVAVLVREYGVTGPGYRDHFARFPGVLWFNDQYLVDPENGLASEPSPDDFRYPCTGAVLAVNEGDPVPRDANDVPYVGASTYVESYLVTDVHDRSWNIDRWTTPSGHPLWSVAILDGQEGYDDPDDGACSGGVFMDAACAPYAPGMGCPRAGPPLMLQGAPGRAKDPGDHGYHYPCGEPGNRCDAISYNAVLFFRLGDLRVAGTPKDHAEGSADREGDVAGCDEPGQPSLDGWPCPEDDDNREGNSHPYNPELPWPAQQYDGRDNHGGSADCGGVDGANDTECHATRRIDVYFGYARIPAARDYWLTDTVGSSAPYHCHAAVPCGPEDLTP